MKEIWYHGTNRKNALSIQKNGFRIGTWFARNIHDAIQFGGKYIFSVGLECEKVGSNVTWQCRTLEAIPAEAIYSLLEIKTIYFDESFRIINFKDYDPKFDDDPKIAYGI